MTDTIPTAAQAAELRLREQLDNPESDSPKDPDPDMDNFTPQEIIAEATVEQRVAAMANIFVELPRPAQIKVLKIMSDFVRDEIKKEGNIGQLVVPGE